MSCMYMLPTNLRDIAGWNSWWIAAGMDMQHAWCMRV